MTYYFLELSEAEPRVLLLGYPLSLSETEYGILCSLCREHPSPLSIDSLATEHSLSANGVAVHICTLNKKAARISGRRLIVFDGGYRLNKFM